MLPISEKETKKNHCESPNSNCCRLKPCNTRVVFVSTAFDKRPVALLFVPRLYALVPANVRRQPSDSIARRPLRRRDWPVGVRRVAKARDGQSAPRPAIAHPGEMPLDDAWRRVAGERRPEIDEALDARDVNATDG
ncbi:hypothetical protein HYQ44_017690 [Verticillium longisporum]|nr:hypothetical protein HYQ44_017690 [Verticillium longisporum]